MAAACEREREPEPRAPENGFVSAEQHALLSRVDGCVLPFLGGFGAYQKRLVALTWIPALFIGFSHFSDYFLLAQPNSTCVEAAGNGTLNWTSPPLALLQDNNYSRSAPDENDLRCACTRWTYELQTGLVQNVVTKWNLVCASAWKVHIAKFSLLVGTIFGYLVLGILADWFGRHLVLIFSVFFTLVFGMTVAFSVDVTMFSTLRFFEGFFLAGITLSLYVLRIELCLPGWRFSMTMVANFLMLAGQLLMPGLATVCGDWQVLQAVIICPLLLMLTYIWLFPESLRWLLATQQYCRSKRIVERIAKTNRAHLDSDELLTELHKALPKKPKKTCIVKVVGTRTLWKNIVVLCVNSLTGYGIHHCFARSMMDPDGKEITMFHNFYADYYTMGGIAVASCMALCPAVGLMGRRGGLLMFMIITALASLLQLGLLNLLGKYSSHLQIAQAESDTLKSKFSVAFSIIGMFSSHAVSNLSIFFCTEITPTVIRGGGLGLVLASAGFGMLTAPIMELHNQKGYFLHHIIFACCTLICIICILLLPETRYQPLPETLADGESYTRQPLLPPRKPAEQRHLLPRSASREYGQVTDTPLHAAAATAVSTMESTASSAIDLSVPPDGEPDTITLYVIKQRKEPAEPAGGPLLTAVPNTSTPLGTSPIHPNVTDSLPDLIANVPPSRFTATETPPTPLSGHTLSQTPPSAASLQTADTSEIPSPSTATDTPPVTDHAPSEPIHLIPDPTESLPSPHLTDLSSSHPAHLTPDPTESLPSPHLTDLSSSHPAHLTPDPTESLPSPHLTDLSSSHPAHLTTDPTESLPSPHLTDLSSSHPAHLTTDPTESLPSPHLTDLSSSHPAHLTTDPTEAPAPLPLTEHAPFGSTDTLPDATGTPPHPSLMDHAPPESPAVTPLISDTTVTPPPISHTPSCVQPKMDGAIVDSPLPGVIPDSVGVPAGGTVCDHLNNVTPPPSTDSPVLLDNDLNALYPATSSLDVLGSFPPPSSSSPIDSDAFLFPLPVVDSTHLETPSPSPAGAAFVPEGPAVPPAEDPFTVDLTVSSPIDSAPSPAADFTTTSSSSPVNSVASS